MRGKIRTAGEIGAARAVVADSIKFSMAYADAIGRRPLAGKTLAAP